MIEWLKNFLSIKRAKKAWSSAITFAGGMGIALSSDSGFPDLENLSGNELIVVCACFVVGYLAAYIPANEDTTGRSA